MPLTQEMFRFVTTRRAERALLSRLASRLMRDRRQTTRNSLLFNLFGPGLFEPKLITANHFAAATDFLDANDPAMRAIEPAVQFFRDKLRHGVALADLAATLRTRVPLLAALLDHAPPAQLLEVTLALTARLWDSLYAQTIRGCDRYVSTNYLVDGLRVYHVLRLLWLCAKLDLSHWAGADFDDYDALIDLAAAFALNDNGDQTPTVDHTPNLQEFNQLQHLTELLEQLDQAHAQVGRLIAAGAVRTEPDAGAGGAGSNGATVAFFDAEAARVLSKLPVLAKFDLATTPVEQVQRQLRMSREVAAVQRQRTFDALIDPNAMHESQVLASRALAQRGNGKVPAAALTSLGSTGGVFRVPLAVGEMKPPLVGDLILVEQELRGYGEGELADIETIMKGERRERTIRKLNRTSSTTSTETLQETEESQSTKTDERFELSSQAQQTAEQSFGLEAGVNVSGKFGPVQVGASVNASFNTSKSSSDSTSQEFAKSVTEEASKKVKNSIKQTSSITVLTENQDTTLRGFNNENGAKHINGMYRWVDKIYEARLMNYGRRMMLSLTVPEPAAFYRALLQQNETAALADLVEPLHPSRIDRMSLRPLEPDDTSHGFLSSKDVNDYNYARLAAFYDVTVTPPPLLSITGSKAIVYPEVAQPKEIQGADTTWVFSDNSLTVDPSYRLEAVGVFVSQGALGKFWNYVDNLELGEDAAKSEEANVILVQVADKDFYLTAYKDPDDNSKKVVNSNFNAFQTIQRGSTFGEGLAGTLPITINTYFQGMLTLTVIYRAVRTDEAYDAWKASTYATILKGYSAKKSSYDQALAAARAKADTGTAAQTFSLRDDQYRSIELTELKRGCIDMLTAGTAAGYTSIAVAADGTPAVVYDSAEGALLGNWRSPLANGAVAEMFETAFEWDDTTYTFYPYYWGGSERWKDLAQASGSDPVFEQFLRAGSANVLVPVRPGFERPVILFLKTGLIWGGGYLPLFNVDDMLDVYADVELGRQFDPPLLIGDPWEIRLPTSMVMLQESDELPEFPKEEPATTSPSTDEPTVDETVPF